ncbi:AMP-binding protein [Candidatus Aalborgicola defluviihabitans]|uniref:AMP-binding protein n=1 Tax=Candidatus Aalborgicola defluviihabitans TaxID=3386187 RepID=UPI001EB146B3|nr:AMP-binding protein [Burkholderiales bacterium]
MRWALSAVTLFISPSQWVVAMCRTSAGKKPPTGAPHAYLAHRLGLAGRQSGGHHWQEQRALDIGRTGHSAGQPRLHPIYPTFNGEALAYIPAHSEARACFIGKMDDTTNLQTGLPKGLPVIALPLAPKLKTLTWNDVLSTSAPLQGDPAAELDAVCTIIYTSGTTGKLKGVVHT